MSTHTYALWQESPTRRYRFEYDQLHETRGSYAYDTHEETKAAEDEEIEKLNTGEWVALCGVMEEKCPTCGNWDVKDAVGGYVVESGKDARLMAKELFGLDPQEEE